MATIWYSEFGRGLPDRFKGASARFSLVHDKVPSYLFVGGPKNYFKKTIPGSAKVRFTVAIEGSEDLLWDTNPKKEEGLLESAPYATVFLWAAPYGILSDSPSHRWYAGTHRANLSVLGTHILEVPLKPTYWSNVWGKRADTADSLKRSFKRTVMHDELRVGVCFGGIFYGHGITPHIGSATISVGGFRMA